MRFRRDSISPDTIVEDSTDDEFDAFKPQPTSHKSSLCRNKVGMPRGYKTVNSLNSNPEKEIKSVLLRNKGSLDVVNYLVIRQGLYTVDRKFTIYRELVGKRLSRLERRQIIVCDPDGQCPSGSSTLWICGGCKRTISIATPISSKAGTCLGYNIRPWLYHKLGCQLLQRKYRSEKAKIRRSGVDEIKSDCLCKLVCICEDLEDGSLEIEDEDLILPGKDRRNANDEQNRSLRLTRRVARRGNTPPDSNLNIEEDAIQVTRDRQSSGNRSRINRSVVQITKAKKSRLWRCTPVRSSPLSSARKSSEQRKLLKPHSAPQLSIANINSCREVVSPYHHLQSRGPFTSLNVSEPKNTNVRLLDCLINPADDIDSYYRFLIDKRFVKYVTMVPGTFTTRDENDLTFTPKLLGELFPPLPVGNWNPGYVGKDPTTGEVTFETKTVYFAEVGNVWHTVTLNELDFVKEERLRQRVHRSIHPDLNDGKPVLIKIAVWPWEIASMEIEMAAYKGIHGTGIGPRFLGKVTEGKDGRVSGFVIEWVQDARTVGPKRPREL